MSSCRSLKGENNQHDGSWGSARLVACQLGHSDCVVRRCWDQLIREMPFTRRPSSGLRWMRRPPHRKKCTRTANCFIGRDPDTGSIFTRGLCIFSKPLRRCLAEGHLGSRRPLRVLPLTSTHRHLRLSGATHEETGLQRNGISYIDVTAVGTDLLEDVSCWHLPDYDSLSDHKAIEFDIALDFNSPTNDGDSCIFNLKKRTGNSFMTRLNFYCPILVISLSPAKIQNLYMILQRN
ncbi:uncharacterized protein TNCV_603891 [Trichonephila clavipes]|nr:uncharacterized protein TNCV_603891 [Trichonephila clavipes]